MARLIAYTSEEGGMWLPVPESMADYDVVPGYAAAKLYDDGRIYDYVLERLGENPWRTQTVGSGT